MANRTGTISRRTFTKAAALTTAAAIAPTSILSQESKAAPDAAKEQSPSLGPRLAPQSQAEADLAYETLMKKYGSRFTEEQKQEVKRLVNVQQSGLDKLRGFSVTNGDEPATVFLPLMPEGRR